MCSAGSWPTKLESPGLSEQASGLASSPPSEGPWWGEQSQARMLLVKQQRIWIISGPGWR